METLEPAETVAAVSQSPRELPLEFRATGGEYFRIWIVNLLLTIVTLGIYSAWAKVRRLRYFYGSTLLDGTSFEYHGKPIAILKGRLIAFAAYVLFVVSGQISPVISALLILPMVCLVPWIIVRARLFQMRMTSWRGLRFNFHGNYGGALSAYFGWMLLAIITLFGLWPLALWKQVNYLLTNTAYGTQRFSFTGTKGRFYKFCALTLLILLGIMVAVGIAMAGVIAAVKVSGIQTPGQGPADLQKIFLSSGFLLGAVVYALGLTFITAYYKASFLNASVGSVEVGPHKLYSRLSPWGLSAILLSNLFLMVVTLGIFYPWAKVRALRYQLSHTGLIADGELNQFVAASELNPGATGEEISEFLDIDFGF